METMASGGIRHRVQTILDCYMNSSGHANIIVFNDAVSVISKHAQVDHKREISGLYMKSIRREA